MVDTQVIVTHQVLTKDSVTVSVDAVVYYRVSNATISVANVANAHHSTRLLAQTTLRNVLGTRPLHEILSDREAISNTMQVVYFTDLFQYLYTFQNYQFNFVTFYIFNIFGCAHCCIMRKLLFIYTLLKSLIIKVVHYLYYEQYINYITDKL